RAAGLKVSISISPEDKKNKKKEIIAELQRVSSKLGTKYLTGKNFINNSKMHVVTIATAFGSWNKALKAAGLKTVRKHRPKSPKVLNNKKKEIIAELQRVSSKLGTKYLTSKNFNYYSKMSIKKTAKAFGSWNKARKAAGIYKK
ncbi:MAG: hypothetical protein HY934_03995, partial [Candidatus Firestonebacteria bacterium]|nr:hypothetical protein [Candidatus Firestonebacteria bacterium]